MSKTLCKWPRKDIESSFDELCQVIASPTYVCRSCARSAADRSFLCKPAALQESNVVLIDNTKEQLSEWKKTAQTGVVVVEPETSSIKQTKKALKRQKKATKKLAKLAKQQKKWTKKQKKLARSFQKLQKQSSQFIELETTPIH